MILALYKRQLRTLEGWEIPPAVFVILVEATKESHLSIEMPKLRKTRSTGLGINDSCVVLSYDVHHALGCLIDIPPPRITSIGKQLG